MAMKEPATCFPCCSGRLQHVAFSSYPSVSPASFPADGFSGKDSGVIGRLGACEHAWWDVVAQPPASAALSKIDDRSSSSQTNPLSYSPRTAVRRNASNLVAPPGARVLTDTDSVNENAPCTVQRTTISEWC